MQEEGNERNQSSEAEVGRDAEQRGFEGSVQAYPGSVLGSTPFHLGIRMTLSIRHSQFHALESTIVVRGGLMFNIEAI